MVDVWPGRHNDVFWKLLGVGVLVLNKKYEIHKEKLLLFSIDGTICMWSLEMLQRDHNGS